MVKSAFDYSNLSPRERLELAEELWDSVLGSPDEVPLTPEQEAEIDRRVALYYADPRPGVPWREFMDQLDAELGQ
jgi:putative addiction module component (TIGR02574 family)